MKTLKELSKEIQSNPDKTSDLLSSFRTTSKEVRDFLFSLTQVPEYIVPALIETFDKGFKENHPQTLRDLMEHSAHLGSLFVLCEDDTDWQYLGKSPSGKAMCRPFNSELVLEISPDKSIKYIF